MRKYELLYVLQPNLEEEQLQTLQERVLTIIREQGGQDTEVKEWGKRRLAYEISDFREGYYVEVHFQGTPQVVAELDRVLKITNGILRHLLVREEE